MLYRTLLVSLLVGLGVNAAPGLHHARYDTPPSPGPSEPQACIPPKSFRVSEESTAPFREPDVEAPVPVEIAFDRDAFPSANVTSLAPSEGTLAAETRRRWQSSRSNVGGSGATDEEAARKREVNGPDDRRLFTGPVQQPYTAMGRLLAKNGLICSAALVGPRHIASARHCVQSGVPQRFQPLYDQGEPFGGAFVTTVIRIPGNLTTMCDHKDDWVVFILDQRLGDKLGWLGYRLYGPDIGDRAVVNTFGYPTDLPGAGERPYIQTNFSVGLDPNLGCSNGGPLISSMDAASGQSGGPLWVDQADGSYQIGMHSASNPGFSVAAHGNDWFDALTFARTTYP